MLGSMGLVRKQDLCKLHAVYLALFTSLWADIGADFVDDTPARISPTHLAPPPNYSQIRFTIARTDVLVLDLARSSPLSLSVD